VSVPQTNERGQAMHPGGGPCRLMGIVNVTPDSFSDGGWCLDPERAIGHAMRLVAAGAEVVDVGGESTRPGASRVDPNEERRRVLPVVRALADAGVVVSIDTTRASTASAALERGARIVNDVSGGLADPGMGRMVAEATVKVWIDDERLIGTGEGNGPVDALDHAFRNAVNGTWQALDRIHLADYKVRILEATAGTDAVTRVLVTATDGTEKWDTVGVHANVVEASWMALSDAYTHAILQLQNGA
jgi:hypothetical protein